MEETGVLDFADNVISELSDYVGTLKSALRGAAEEAYRSEILETGMEESLVGEGKEYLDREDWIEGRLMEWLYPEEF